MDELCVKFDQVLVIFGKQYNEKLNTMYSNYFVMHDQIIYIRPGWSEGVIESINFILIIMY